MSQVTLDKLIDMINNQPTETVEDRIRFHRLIDLYEALLAKQQQEVDH